MLTYCSELATPFASQKTVEDDLETYLDLAPEPILKVACWLCFLRVPYIHCVINSYFGLLCNLSAEIRVLQWLAK